MTEDQALQQLARELRAETADLLRLEPVIGDVGGGFRGLSIPARGGEIIASVGGIGGDQRRGYIVNLYGAGGEPLEDREAPDVRRAVIATLELLVYAGQHTACRVPPRHSGQRV